MLRCCWYPSPLGSLLLTAEDKYLVGLWMEGQRFFGMPFAESLPLPKEPTAVLREAVVWLDAYFAGSCPDAAALPVALCGTAFQQRVWQELRRIPYGESCTYGELARCLGSSARAVGGAVGRNPLIIVVPCHRVVGADGALGGYAGGEERKLFLLAHERAGAPRRKGIWRC